METYTAGMLCACCKSERFKFLLKKIGSLVLAGIVMGWAYSWAAPRFYKPDQTAGFWLGNLHGALMPVALPTLLMGEDVPIFATKNNGRPYKIGYIFGINACGLLFFGLTFWKPKSGEGAGPKPPSTR